MHIEPDGCPAGPGPGTTPPVVSNRRGRTWVAGLAIRVPGTAFELKNPHFVAGAAVGSVLFLEYGRGQPPARGTSAAAVKAEMVRRVAAPGRDGAPVGKGVQFPPTPLLKVRKNPARAGFFCCLGLADGPPVVFKPDGGLARRGLSCRPGGDLRSLGPGRRADRHEPQQSACGPRRGRVDQQV